MLPTRCPAIAAIAICALIAFACGGKQAQPTSSARDAAGPVVLPPPPVEPMRLLPEGVQELLSVNLKQLRASPHYALAERWIRRHGCLEADPSHFLLERTERLVVASYADAERRDAGDSLAVLRGEYRKGDAERALQHAGSLLGAAPAPATEQPRGRFQLVTSGGLSAALLGDRMMVVGNPARVLAALDVADGKRPAWTQHDALIAGLDADRWVSEHTAASILRVDGRTAQRLGRELSAIGGRRLGEGLHSSAAALAFVLGDEFNAEAQVLYTDARVAAEAADGLRSVVARADLVLRLTGFPSAVERTRVSAEGERLNVTLTLSSADLERLASRIQPLLDGSTPACGEQAAAGQGAGQPRAAR